MPEPAVTVRLPARLREALKAHAESARRNQSAVVVEALRQYLVRDSRQNHIQEINEGLQRLDEIERNDPDLLEFYKREKDP